MGSDQRAALVRGRGWRIPPRILDPLIAVLFGVAAVLTVTFGPFDQGGVEDRPADPTCTGSWFGPTISG